MTVTGATLRFNCDTRDRADRRARWTRSSTARPCRSGSRWPSRRGSVLDARRASAARASARISPCRAASTCPSTWAAARRSRWASSAVTVAARCARAMCCACIRVARDARPPLRVAGGPAARLRPTRWEIGVHRTDRMARRISSLPRTSRRFFAADWEVHYNSSRTGVRLIGPKPRVGAQRWRRGRTASLEHPRQRVRDRQHRLHRRHAGDPRARRAEPGRIRLSGHHRRCRTVEARAAATRRSRAVRALVPRAGRQALQAQDAQIADFAAHCGTRHIRARSAPAELTAIVRDCTPRRVPRSASGRPAKTTCSWSSAEPVLDLALRFQVQALLEELRRAATRGLLDLTPGIRSLQVHFDARRAARRTACSRTCCGALDELPDVRSMALPSRIVHLPLSWDDPATRLATAALHAVGAHRRALVPGQHRVHPPHQRPRFASRTCGASCSTRATS